MIYKILSQNEWSQAQQAGEFAGSAVDHSDGFIHFSSALQVTETAAKHFAGQNDLILLAIDEILLGDELKWEVSRGGGLFPHLYATLDISSVKVSDPLPLDENGKHVFPDTFNS